LSARWFRSPLDSSLRRREISYRPRVEPLEERILLDAGLPPALVVGRTLSSYFVGGIQNHQETITYAVYNEQADTLTGVLLTDTLEPGVTVASASQLPDQSGQKLAWSLGSIRGFDRASVTLTVNLPSTIPLQLDAGAAAFATLNAGLVTNSTPAAVLRPGNVSDPSLLAATPDTDATDLSDAPNLPISDPFIQEEAAKLSYNAQNIFNFLENDIGYNSYSGSLRGARGTLWSSAGNALDVASLGVALMRASGIPARYVSGTLSQGQAQALIRSMFPADYQTVGYVPAGSDLADPANDPTLLSETENHYWFQFDTGGGMQDADPLVAAVTSGGHVGQAFATPTGSPFPEVPDNLREKTEVSLTAEIYSNAAGAFGLPAFTNTVVLDQTFNDVNLVGRPLTVGNFVGSNSAGAFGVGATTNTYSPYLELSDEAVPDPAQDEILQGQEYQEYLTSFPLGSQILTGLFLNLSLSGPQGAAQTFTKTLVDRLGYAVRQGGASIATGINTSGPPIVSNLDLWTIDALPGLQSPDVLARQSTELAQLQGQLDALQPLLSAAATNPAPPAAQSAAVGAADTLDRNVALNSNENLAIVDAGASDTALAQLEAGYRVTAYYVRPRLVVASTQHSNNQLSQALDLLNTATRDLPAPGQVTSAAAFMEMARGLLENRVEAQVLASATGQTPVGFGAVLNALAAQGGSLVTISTDNLSQLDSLPLSVTAKARITQAVNAGLVVYAPSQMVTVNGQTTVGWLETDWSTGHTTDVMEDGGHQELVEFVALLASPQNIAAASFAGTLDGFAISQLKFLGNVLGGLNSGRPFATVVKLAKLDLVTDLVKDYASLLVGTIPIPGDVNALIALGLEIAKIIGGFGAGKLLTGKSPDFLDIGKSVFELIVGTAIPGAGAITTGYEAGLVAGSALGIAYLFTNLPGDPPAFNFLSTELAFLPRPPLATVAPSVAANRTAGSVTASLTTQLVSAAGSLNASWSTSASASNFLSSTLTAPTATVKNANGVAVGSGSVALAAGTLTPVGVSGTDQFTVNGSGSLSFYGPAESGLGVSGSWTSYTASVKGNVTLTLTTDALTLNGHLLAAGTYAITTNVATLGGSGSTTSPNFSGSASLSLTATGASINLGAGSGTITVGGKPLDLTSGGTIDVYAGGITVAATGTNTDNVTLGGNATKVLTVSATPNTLTTDQNTPKTFHVNVNTSLADTYNLTAQAPPGWTVSIDGNNNVTVTPAAGLQGGTYPIQVVAQSTTDPSLVAQTTVNVTVTPTVAGLTFSVQPDPLLTVPFSGAEVPTAYQAVVHNNGPMADTYNLTFANVPTGFTLLGSATSVTVPAGQTGIVGLYLQPNGTVLLPPGTPLSFDMTATSTANPAITQKVTESFAMPAVDGVAKTSPAQVAATPGGSATTTLTLQNVGNEPETVTLSDSGAAGLSVSGLAPVSLAVGQTKTITVTLTPGATAALNGTLSTTITGTYGPAANRQTTTAEIDVDVVSTSVLAVAQAAAAAGQDGSNAQLAQVLTALQNDVAQLQTSPTNATVLAQLQYHLGSVSSFLSSDPALAPFVPQLQPIQTDANTGNVTALIGALPTFFNALTSVLAVEATQQFTVSVSPNVVDVEPGQTKNLAVTLVNTGKDPVALTLSAPGLPANVTAGFSNTQVMLAAGATDTETATVSNTLVSSTSFQLNVTAAASLVTQFATAAVDVQSATADVLGVTVTPTNPNAGDPVSVTAEVFNAANVARTVLAHIDVLDLSGNVVATPPEVSFNLVPGSGNLNLDLGQVATTGLTTGVYTMRVTLRAGDDTPLPGQSSQTLFAVGQLVTASVAASPSVVPPGTSTVATTITAQSNITTAPRGKIFVANDEYPLDDSAFSSAPDTAQFVKNLVNFFTGGQPGSFLAYSDNHGLTGSRLATAMQNDGITWTVSTSVPFTLANLKNYNAVFIGGFPADNQVLTEYVNSGGNVYLLGGTGTSGHFGGAFGPGGATAEASAWNSFLGNFGLAFSATYNNVIGNTTITSSDPIFTGVSTLYQDVGQDVLTTGGSGKIIDTFNNEGLYADFVGQSSVTAVVTDNLPATGYAVDPSSISPAATSSSASRVVWNGQVAGGGTSQFQLSGTVSNMAPGEVRQISTGTTVATTASSAPSVKIGPGGSAYDQSNAFDYQNISVTSNTPLISGFDIRDLFGGEFGTTSPEGPGHIGFVDRRAGQVDTVTFTTPSPVTLTGFSLVLNEDNGFDGVGSRSVTNFALAVGNTTVADVPIIPTGGTYLSSYGADQITVTVTFAAVTGTTFTATFTANNMEFTGPRAFGLEAITPANVLYVTSPALPGIQQVDTVTGAVTNVFTTPGAAAPTVIDSLIFDKSGDIIYTLPDAGEVGLYNPHTGSNSLIASGLNIPGDLALDPGGASVLVSQRGVNGNDSIARINLTTDAVTSFSDLSFPQGIAYDDAGNLFVNESGANALVQLDPTTGATIQVIPLHSRATPDGVTFDPVTGAFWVADSSGGLIEVSNYLTSPQVQEFPSPILLEGQIFDGIESDGMGDIYIAEYNGTNTGRIDQYNIATNTYTALTSLSIDDLAPLVGGGAQQLTQTIDLPPVTVAAEHIISLGVPVETEDRNASTAYTVVLTNPLSTDETYHLGVTGLPGFATNLPASVDVPAGQTVDVPLQVTVPAGAAPGTEAFQVQVTTGAGASDSVEGQLIVAPTVQLPSLAVQVGISPSSATAGQGTSATYTVTVTNVGTATDTYTLAAAGLPAGVTASFSPPTISVPPGLSNFRDVTLTLTPRPGTAAGIIPFQVKAAATTDATVMATGAAKLTVVSRGVAVALTPSTGAPGSTFTLKVTNTGIATDTFTLSLAGPAALVARLARTAVTLAAGASTTVTVTTTAVAFAVPGTLPLMALATSQGNKAVQASASAALQIPATTGLTAGFSPSVQVVPVPGTSKFLLLVNNVGNTQDRYSASITGTTGGITAELMGLDGLPTTTVPEFFLPGLASGALLLEMDLAALGTATVNVTINSLSNPQLKVIVTATVKPPPPPPPRPARSGRAFG
jgi:uncharacterized membrane protein